jgi:hypothetical protein
MSAIDGTDEFLAGAWTLSTRVGGIAHSRHKRALASQPQWWPRGGCARTPADDDDIAYIARGVLRAAESGVAPPPIRGWQCKGCPYMAVCS